MTEFDSYSDSYESLVEQSISFANCEHEYFTRRKADALLDVTARLAGDPTTLKVLDVGCGVGSTDAFLSNRFHALHGIDTAPAALEQAARRNPTVEYESYDGTSLPFDDGSFDVAFAICVLHHVDPEARAHFVGEMRRVVRPGGIAAIFEHNPFNPLTRVAVSRCEFDDGVVLSTRRRVEHLLRAAAMTVVEARYILFTTSERLRPIERALRGFPLGAQHYVVARK